MPELIVTLTPRPRLSMTLEHRSLPAPVEVALTPRLDTQVLLHVFRGERGPPGPSGDSAQAEMAWARSDW